MDQISKYIANKNNIEEVFVSNKTVEPIFFVKGKIRNISCEGMNFESNYPFSCEDSIFLKMPNIFRHEINDSVRFCSANVKWSKRLRNSTFKNEYGIEFNEPLQFPKIFFSVTKGHQQFLSLPKLLGIAGMGLLILCCGLNLFFFLRPVSESIELMIIGFGFLSFVRCFKIITKDPKSDHIKEVPENMSSLTSQSLNN